MGDKKVYVSGALTGVNEPDSVKRFYESIAELCKAFNMNPYVPHLNSDPIAHPDLSPREVYEMDKREISRAELVIAYVGIPSLGVGSEIEIARENDIPVILLYEKNKKISRMIRGNPAIMAEISFTNFDNALQQLQAFLEEHCSAVS